MIGEIKYTDEVVAFIKENTDKSSIWLSREINTKFNLDTTPRGVQSWKYRHGVQRKEKWSGEIEEFIKENFNIIPHYKMVVILKEKFNFETTTTCLSTIAKSKWGLKYDLSPKKRHKPIGSEVERIYKTGKKRNCIYVKYRDLPTNKKDTEYKINWTPKPRWIYEQTFGILPKNYAVIQLDGDYRNCNIENLKAVPKSIVPKITKKYGYGIVTEAMIEVLMLEEDMKRLNDEE